MKRFVSMALIVAVVFAASMASAALVDFNGVSSSVSVNITAPNLGTVNTQAGYYQITVDSVSYNAFCVDPSYANYNPIEYTVLSAATMENKYKAAAWVLDFALNNTSTNIAAAQVAAWELVFDWGNSVNLTEGLFKLNSPDSLRSIAATYAQNALDNYASWQGVNNYSVAVNPYPNYYGVDYQDFVFAFKTQTVDPPPVPIPPTVWLLGAGLVGLVGLRRKFGK